MGSGASGAGKHGTAQVVIADVKGQPGQGSNAAGTAIGPPQVKPTPKLKQSKSHHWSDQETTWASPSGFMGKVDSARARPSAATQFDRQVSDSTYNIMDKIAAKTGDHFDLVVIGAGPAGVKAAIEAAGRGMRVGLIEPKATLTGAPTGAHSKCFREAALHGVTTFEQVAEIAKTAKLKTQRSTGRQLRSSHVCILKGLGYILSETQVRFLPSDGSPRTLTFEVLILATGSRSNRIPNIPYELEGVYDSDTIRTIDYIPENLVVQGAGIIGLEYALIFSKLGSKVTVIEAWDKVVPMLDGSLQAACKRTMSENGVAFLLSTLIRGVVKGKGASPGKPKLRVDCGDRVFECDCLLSAPGRVAQTENLGLNVLEPLGLKYGRGKCVQVDENGWTGVGKIYAVGDIAGSSLATVGQAAAVRAVRSVFGTGYMKGEKVKTVKPSGVWTIPEMAWAGITEEEAMKAGLNYGSAIIDYEQTVRGCVTGEHGFLKLLYDMDNGKALGVHLFGESSTDLVNYGAEVVNDGDTIFEMLQFVFPAVTYHELYHLAAQQAKFKFRFRGANNIRSATAWCRVQAQLLHSLKESDKMSSVDEAIKKAFQYFDSDRSGEITVQQLKTAVESLGIRISDDDCEEMVVEATGGEEGGPMTINVDQFMRMLKR